jgi:hypothetical protein
MMEIDQMIDDDSLREKKDEAHGTASILTKPPSALKSSSSKTSLRSENSKSSLKKSARSSSILNASKLNAIQESAIAMIGTAGVVSDAKKSKLSKKSITKTIGKQKSVEKNEHDDECEEDKQQLVEEKAAKSKKKVSVSKKLTKKDSVEVCTLDEEDMIAFNNNEIKPLKANLVKKKSTLNRLTEMISKSPILEPLRSKKFA